MTDSDYSRHVFRAPKLKSIVKDAIEFFSKTPAHNLSSSDHFLGAGVYGLYYLGDFELYAKITKLNLEEIKHPIYIGKAVPPGWRTARTKDSNTPDLCRRLQEHAKNVKQASNLNIDDFKYRFMILDGVEGDLVVPVEAELIRKYKPLWNVVVDGFGNHDPGSGRYNQSKSEWDALHPGRYWTTNLTGKPPELERVIEKVRQYTK